jgi:hypothetical protein
MMFQFVAGAPCSGRRSNRNFTGRAAERVAALPLQPVCAPAAVSVASFAARASFSTIDGGGVAGATRPIQISRFIDPLGRRFSQAPK